MPRLIAARPGAVATGVDLGGCTWRLLLGAGYDGTVGALSLFYQPASPPAQLRSDGLWIPPTAQELAALRVELLRVPVPFAPGADGYQGMARVAQAASDAPTFDIAQVRTQEALTLFKNMPVRISDTAMEETRQRCTALVAVVWQVRAWLVEGAAEKKTWELTGEQAQLVGVP